MPRAFVENNSFLFFPNDYFCIRNEADMQKPTLLADQLVGAWYLELLCFWVNHDS